MNMIDADLLNLMIQTGMLAFTIPVVLIVAWKMRTKKSVIPFWAGVVVFLLFAQGLENIPHLLFVITDNPLSRIVNGNAVIYALYGGLMAGLFEELGRYVAFRFLVKKYPEKETAVTYGIGHGGVECMLIMGVGFIQYYMYGQLINNGTMDKMLESMAGDPKSLEALQTLVDMITNMEKSACWIAGWERISALVLHIGLSILVFQAVKVAEKKYMLWVAVGLHMLFDIPAALYQKGVLGLIPTEIILSIMAAFVLLYSIGVYRSMEGEKNSVKEASSSFHKVANQKLKDK